VRGGEIASVLRVWAIGVVHILEASISVVGWAAKELELVAWRGAFRVL